jgi:hypothetical protein
MRLEPGLHGRGDDLGEPALRDMPQRLDKEQESRRLQRGPDLGEKGLQVLDLMGHPEDKRQIGLDVQTQAILGREVEADAAGDPGPLRAPPRLFEHLRLDVDGHDQAALADDPGHGDREEPRAAADVDGRVTRSKERAQDAGRVVGHPPEDVRQGKGQPGGTEWFGHGPAGAIEGIKRAYYAFGMALLSMNIRD